MGHVRNRRGEGVRLRTDILAAATGLLDRGGERAVTLRAVVHAAFAELNRRTAAAHPRRYRAMFGATCEPTELDGRVLRLFTDVLADCAAAEHSASTDPVADAVALWLGLHGLAHQRTVMRIFPWSATLEPYVAASLALVTPMALLVAGTAQSISAANRAQRGASESEQLTAKLVGASWVIGFVALFLAITGLVAAAALFLNPPGLFWLLAVAGGGGYAVAAVLERRRLAARSTNAW